MRRYLERFPSWYIFKLTLFFLILPWDLILGIVTWCSSMYANNWSFSSFFWISTLHSTLIIPRWNGYFEGNICCVHLKITNINVYPKKIWTSFICPYTRWGLSHSLPKQDKCPNNIGSSLSNLLQKLFIPLPYLLWTPTSKSRIFVRQNSWNYEDNDPRKCIYVCWLE